MNLRAKVILLTATVALVAVAGVSLGLNMLLDRGVREERERDAVTAVRRAQALTQQYLWRLERSAMLVARHPATLDIVGGGAIYDLPAESLMQDLDLNALAIVDEQGEFLLALAPDASSGEFFPFPTVLVERYLTPDSAPLSPVSVQAAPKSGVVGGMAIAAWPIALPAETGGGFGAVYVGSPFLPTDLPVEELASGEISLVLVRDIQPGSLAHHRFEELATGDNDVIARQASSTEVTGWWLVRDVFGEPLALSSVTVSSRVSLHVNQARTTAVVVIIVGAIAGFLGMLALLDRSVVAPIMRLTAHVRRISDTRDISQRLPAQQGEVGLLAATMNEMLASVEAAQASERSLAERLVDVEEQQCREIATELHDEIGQSLTGLKLMLESAEEPPSVAHPRIAEARQLVSSLMGQVRDISLELRPSILDDLGVGPALSWLTKRYETQTGIDVSLEHPVRMERFPASVETAVYRITQEALTNVARHSGSRSVWVDLQHEGQALRLEVRDDGRGFDAMAHNGGYTSGVRGMRERALALGGTFVIDSAPGTGTRLTVEFPLDQDSN